MEYTWKNLEADCENISNLIILDNYDAIVGIARGGMILATMLSEISGNKKLYSIGYSSYEGKNKTELRQTMAINPDLKNLNILLCDDISDSGKTLDKAYKDLSNLGNEVMTVALFFKGDSLFIPDLTMALAKDWISFPWE